MDDTPIAVGIDTNAIATQLEQDVISVVDPSAAKAAILDVAASSAVDGNDPLGDFIQAKGISIPDSSSLGIESLGFKTVRVAYQKDIIKGTMKAPSDILEKAKSGMFGAASSLKASFNTLPKSIQAAIIGDTGILSSSNSFRLPGYTVSSNIASFFNKVTSGDYVLNPKSFKMDVKNLSAFTTSALKNGIFDSALKIGMSFAGKPGTISNILTKVAVGSVIAKNKKGLLKMGLSMSSAGSVSMPMSAGKINLVRTVFKDLKLPKVKAKELDNLHTEVVATANVFDKNSTTSADGKATAAAFTQTKAGSGSILDRLFKKQVKNRPTPSATLSDLNTVPTTTAMQDTAVAVVTTNAVTEPEPYTGDSYSFA